MATKARLHWFWRMMIAVPLAWIVIRHAEHHAEATRLRAWAVRLRLHLVRQDNADGRTSRLPITWAAA